MKYRTLIAMMLALFFVMTPAADYCVRAGASGANNGSNWTDAFPSLPAALVRGAT